MAVSATLLQVGLTLFGLVLVTFVIGRLVPIDPVLAIVGDRATPDVYEAARNRLGLDQPIWRQFLGFAADVLRGDFGSSVLTGKPVIEDLGRFFPATVELATAAILLGTAFGVPAGVWAAVRQGRLVDGVVRLVTLIGYSVPIFWLGIVALVVFYAQLGWTAGPGRLDTAFQYDIDAITGFVLVDTLLAGSVAAFVDALFHLVLPASVLALYAGSIIARITRTALLAELNQDYVVAARVKGLRPRRIVWRHALANAAGPIVTTVALSYGSLLEGSVLTETVFAWPGLGLYITQSLFSADLAPVIGATIVVGLVFVGLNLIADLATLLLDPRTR